MLSPDDFATKEEAWAYANRMLNEWREKFKELEGDMIFLMDKYPLDAETARVANKWLTEVQEVGAK